ncbi:MAG: hypothetical protein JST26_11190 [Bacteroidetes bacterium]|nr:hypothetical protein [Bacteroidota bacterium]
MIETDKFSISSNGHCQASKTIPDQKAIRTIIASSKKKYLKENTVLIARYQWLKRNKLSLPEKMELPNLCIVIKEGKLIRAFYSNVLTHIIKKQNYYLQVLN